MSAAAPPSRVVTRPIVVMGVSGSGKSTIGAALASALGRPFVDGDALHPPANIAKMSAGTPLSDADRWPWLDAVGERLTTDPAIIAACSALRRRYRDRLRSHCPQTCFVHLSVDEQVLEQRIRARAGHFMPPELLRSQLDTLEGLQPDESGLTVDATGSARQVVAQIMDEVGRG